MEPDRVTWRKSSYSTTNGGGCVEVALRPSDVIGVRDSKDPDGPELGFAPERWRAFTDQVKAGVFDPA